MCAKAVREASFLPDTEGTAFVYWVKECLLPSKINKCNQGES